jgi:hypothetical protein
MICIGRRYRRSRRAVGKAHQDQWGGSGESEKEEAVGGRGVGVVGVCDGLDGGRGCD